jgi:zinc protease
VTRAPSILTGRGSFAVPLESKRQMAKVRSQTGVGGLSAFCLLPFAFCLLALVVAGCAAQEPPPPITGVQIPALDTIPRPKHPAREDPPPSGPARPFHLPKPAWAELAGGLRVATVASKALPLVQIRVVVLAGRAADGERPGLAALTAELLEDGGAGRMSSRELVTRVASMGGELRIDTGFDATVLSLALTKDRLAEGLGVLADMVARPQLSPAELEKLKKRRVERAADAARTSGAWGASMVLHKDLFLMPAEQHPYAAFSATPEELAKITAAECRAFHKRFYTPRNTFVVVAGDTTPEATKQAAEKAFAGYAGGEAPGLAFGDPVASEKRRITLVDRPKSSQSDVYVGVLGPALRDREWAAFMVANQVLGGGMAGRLFADVREKRSLAYAARSNILELAHGRSVMTAYAGTQTAKTGLALQALLDNLERLSRTAPDADEVERASRYLTDVLAVRLETLGEVANELVHLEVMDLPEDHDDALRRELGEVTPALVLKAASDRIHPGREVIVVAGDAAVVGPMLSHFGEVKVLDPTREFARERTIPMAPDAPLEVPREPGK